MDKSVSSISMSINLKGLGLKSMKSHHILKALVFFCFSMPLWLLGKESGPDPKLTGGFNESTCIQCHASHKLNEGRLNGGSFEIEGLPEKYEAGKSYTLKMLIAHPNQLRWGFELSARYANGGAQAARLIPLDSNTQVKEEGGISYIMHTRSGTKEGTKDRASFSFTWVAPEASAGMIVFNAAGNAANGNDEPTGDYIYTAGGFSFPAGGITEITGKAVKHTGDTNSVRLRETPILINMPVPVDLNRGDIEIHVQHRFFQSLQDSSAGTAFGIDYGANINLGVNYALTNKLSVGISRAREDQLVSLNAAYEIRTKSRSMWKMSLLGGLAGKHNFEDTYSPYIQLAAALDYRTLRLNLTPAMIFNSRDEALSLQPGPEAINPDRNSTFSLGIGADYAIHRRFSILGEYVPQLAGFGGFFGRHSQLGAGVAIRTRDHVFTVLVSRSRNFVPVRYAVNGDFNGVSLGFNIYRRIE
jgi:hypothetical protein